LTAALVPGKYVSADTSLVCIIFCTGVRHVSTYSFSPNTVSTLKMKYLEWEMMREGRKKK